MADFKLPPIKVQSVITEVSEIPWGVQMVNAPGVWDKTRGEGVVVAVLDTGIDSSHPDLVGRVIDGRNFTDDYNGNPKNFFDNQSHGTHVAGTIAAVSNNLGVVGVAPDVKLLVGKVLAGDGSGSYDSIIQGIKWAVDWRGPNGERARVISMSLGGPQDFPELHQAIKYAVANDVLVVAASGNEGDGSTRTNEFSYPGAYQEVVEVGAIDYFKQLAEFSNTNDEIDVVAPGVDVLSTIPGGQWAKYSGTSMATPHVSAVAALLIALNETPEKSLKEEDVYQLLLNHAVTLKGDTKGVGRGLAHLSLDEESPSPSPTPVEIPNEYEISVRRNGKKYNVEIGHSLSRDTAENLALQLASDLEKANAIVKIIV